MTGQKQPEAQQIADRLNDNLMAFGDDRCRSKKRAIDELRRLYAENTAQHAELVAEAARTSEEKLRADQMTEQHRMQCNMRQESEDVLDAAKEHIRDLEAQLSAIGAGGVEALRKRDGLQQSAEVVEPEFFTVFASHNGGKIALPGYSNETEKGVKDLVLQAARQEGYKGTVAGRLLELGWWIGPVFASSADAAAPAQAVAVPEVGSAWRHTNGAAYRVIAIANADTEDHARYPVTVVYQGENGKTWARRASDWLRSMTPDPTPAQEHATQLAGQGQDALQEVFKRADRLIDVMDDYDQNAPEHRSYVSGAYEDSLNDLRRAVTAARAAPAQAQEDARDAELFRAMANAAITEDAAFGECLERLGGDCKTIDDIRAVFDAARAAQGGAA